MTNPGFASEQGCIQHLPAGLRRTGASTVWQLDQGEFGLSLSGGDKAAGPHVQSLVLRQLRDLPAQPERPWYSAGIYPCAHVQPGPSWQGAMVPLTPRLVSCSCKG